MIEDNWDSLDCVAKSNLSTSHYERFIDYKETLKIDGHSWEDAKDILTGFIRDMCELYLHDEMNRY